MQAKNGGTEVWVLRDVRRNEVLQGLALDAGTLLRELRAEDALNTDHVRVQEQALPVIREMAAAQDRRARAGP